MARLENWSLVGKSGTQPLAVRGEIHGDERFSDATPITTSRLHYLDPGGHFACTRNHTYELGTVSDAFARWMGDAGKTLAGYAAALEAKDKKAPRVTRLAPDLGASITRPTPMPAGIATALMPSPTGAPTALVQSPTTLVRSPTLTVIAS